MDVGSKGGGKHWTAEQVAARQKAAEGLTRKQAAKLTPPPWLSKQGRVEWNKIMRDVKGLDLVDVLDESMIALYCESIVMYKALMAVKDKDIDTFKAIQAEKRLIAAYADKLGFTPASRARLIKKRSDEKPEDNFGSDFDK